MHTALTAGQLGNEENRPSISQQGHCLLDSVLPEDHVEDSSGNTSGKAGRWNSGL